MSDVPSMLTEVPRADADVLRLGPKVRAGGARPPDGSCFFLDTIMRDGRRAILASNWAFWVAGNWKKFSSYTRSQVTADLTLSRCGFENSVSIEIELGNLPHPIRG